MRVLAVALVHLALSGCYDFGHVHGRCESDENCARAEGRGHCLFGRCQECAVDVHCAAGTRCSRGRCTNANVLFRAGAFHQDAASLTKRDLQAHEDGGGALSDFCQGPRDAVDTCAREAPGCVPLPIPHAWSPCYGSGALCTEIYREGERARMMASPPQCFCSCGPEHAAAHVRHEALMRDPPP